MALREDIKDVINRNSAENASDTPDSVLAEYLICCLAAFDTATNARDRWYGRPATPTTQAMRD